MYDLVVEAFQTYLRVDVTLHEGFTSADQCYKTCWQKLRLTIGELRKTWSSSTLRSNCLCVEHHPGIVHSLILVILLQGCQRF